MRIPLSGPDIGSREIELVNHVLGTRYLSIGPMIERFERLTATYIGRRHGGRRLLRHGGATPMHARARPAAG